MNYEKVLKMMQVVEWHYIGKPVTLEDIKEVADRVRNKALKEKKNVSCGGFMYLYSEKVLLFVGEKAYE